MSLNRCLIAEFLGTFLLVLFGCGSVVTNEVFAGAVTLVGVALAFGLIIMVVVDTLGAVSGAHINPAVSVGLAAAGLFPWKRVVPYVAVQCLGAFAASYFHAEVIVPERPSTLAATVPRTVDGDFREAESWTVEFTLAAILMLVILRVATGPKEGQAGAGLTIGMTVA
ncbi:MAG: MIP/aquaporin family protein, partial [Planctomycetota bacterium]